MQSLQDIHTALTDYGFIEYTPWKRGVYKYNGQLHTSRGSIDIELTLKGFDKPPSIRLVKVPEVLKPRAPHIGVNGSLCYTANGAIAMDIFNPASQVISCINRATEVLSQILEGKRVADLAEEFFIYWDSQNILNEQVYLDTKDTNSGYVSVMGITKASGEILSAVITDDRSRTLKKLEVFGLSITNAALAACIIETTERPMPLTNGLTWPPATLDDFINWQHMLDPKSARSIIRRMKSIYEGGERFAIILISSPTAKYSANVTFPDVNVALKSITQARKVLGPSKLRVMNTSRIDDTYMVERNQPNRQSLISKRILLIGAGAIGGHLADLLVRSGAGLGGGKLTIIDKDQLGVGNIGRHKLGFESLYSYKSEALAKQLKISFPTADIDPVNRNVKDYALTDGFDLVINATGEQSLSDWLSMKLNQDQFSPMLTVWIEGPGAVVRSILQPTKADACYRCLADVNRTPLYLSVNEEYEIKLGGHGCESLYVEYPATAAVFAASLASAHIMDWVNGEGSPLLRTMVIDRKYTRNSDDQDPIKQVDCPACHTTENG